MKKLSKFLALAMSIVMIVGLFAGCGEVQPPVAATPEPTAEVTEDVVEEPVVEEAEKVPEIEIVPFEPVTATPDYSTGVLALLNLNEKQRKQIADLRELADHELNRQGYLSNGFVRNGTREIIYYDTLNTMLMALNANQIESMEIYQSVANYLCKQNKDLVSGSYKWEEGQSAFVRSVMKSILSDDFSFLMMKDKEALKKDFDSAIRTMKLDGTLDKLVKEWITDVGELTPVAMPKIEGADTIRVAVTGDLPPLDYVSADGIPAGFNTAVLAEISDRIGKNIELVTIDSGARATALASGNVDVVFWAITSDYATRLSSTDVESIYTYMSAFTDEEKAVVDKMRELVNFDYASIDLPEGTIISEPYYSDFNVPVMQVAHSQTVEKERAEKQEKQPQIPRVTKSPTSETVYEGDSCYFSAKHENAIWALWHFVSPDGRTDFSAYDAPNRFPGLEVIGGDQTTMQLKYIPLSLSGWRVYCVFSNNDGGVRTGSAIITVRARQQVRPTPTPTPQVTHIPAPSVSPSATPTTPSPSPTTDPKTVVIRPAMWVWAKDYSSVEIFETMAGWYDANGVFYYNDDNGITFINSVTGVEYAEDPTWWLEPEDIFDHIDVVNANGQWITLYNVEGSWFDGEGVYFISEDDDSFRNSITGEIYAGSMVYFNPPEPDPEPEVPEQPPVPEQDPIPEPPVENPPELPNEPAPYVEPEPEPYVPPEPPAEEPPVEEPPADPAPYVEPEPEPYIPPEPPAEDPPVEEPPVEENIPDEG